MSEFHLPLPEGKKAYFASDFHLGVRVGTRESELVRERRVVRWLHAIAADAGAVFLLGDLFDFWFDYRHAVPRGHTRFQGAVAALTDAGIPVWFFTGNHDLWMSRYFEEELGVRLFRKPVSIGISGRSFMLGHGDGLGPGDGSYKLLKRVFTNPLAQSLFRLLHPDLGIALARRWSAGSRLAKLHEVEHFKGEDEYLLQHCREVERAQHHDFYIFGHRHLVLDVPIAPNSRYINLGDWLNASVYAVFDGHEISLENRPA
jgi:UDP-2,3-diacylglucosamine hydrolase